MNAITKFLFLLMGSRVVAIFAGIGIMIITFTIFPVPSEITENDDPLTKSIAFIGIIAVWGISVIIMKFVIRAARNKIFTEPGYEKVSKQHEYNRDEL